MSGRDVNTDTPSGQGQNIQENLYDRIREFVASLGLSASDGLIQHAGDTTHEDLKVVINPQDQECSVAFTTASYGTLTPASSIRSAPDRLQSLIPPFNYGAVIPGCVYRSGYPKEENFGFLKELGIKTILTLVPEPISPAYQNFMKEAGIQHFHAHIRANKGEVRVESCEMSRALRLIMDRANHPILVHCNKGKHRTGCTIACFRRVLGVDPETVREEYHTYAGPKARFLDEVFFENFDLNLVMWIARQEGWVAPQIDIAPPTPPASITSSVGAKTVALA
ncbi:Protein tyrosine serine phosphatase [Pyrenophora tritici-repentis]|uniref:diphosphoinositol-polyphosphate diphosphatase n=2 Tax=Pyrenophora tritici-repentis TaxID=45151 RepID=A0A2W1DZ98_9PLEO|nr:tyrosine-protein phosphatase SIW14 [Pyrenophora tritici-repentis Pt-1C-BFP]KAA8619791.1 Tyrosine-protein phosphatase SIW14 [Pyrenophora tritici-repentis]EDU46959.1 tyrosine-protein phosphatase SIW14 [Pyrenophora tritici-repentis Pt-1C-BFP]KAF7447932.1 Tyrosine-protein phosphatase SIW14 [Pyrenophora tritici-repentis]KAF7571638.1 Protein tyrosine/serine phosphatase [Pyrenophora tritici-repentis]KAG9385143.1 Tyrosine-protein phosphatase SIW14 [Pyrenophora tritici-repentis]